LHSFPTRRSSDLQKLIELGLTKNEALELAKMYGSNIHLLHDYINNNLKELPTVLYAQLKYAIDYEMAMTPIDFFMRRNSSLLYNIEQVKFYKDAVLQLMKKEFNWTNELKSIYDESLKNEILIATTVSK